MKKKSYLDCFTKSNFVILLSMRVNNISKNIYGTQNYIKNSNDIHGFSEFFPLFVVQIIPPP